MELSEDFLSKAFQEDLSELGDLTTLSLMPKDQKGEGQIICKEDLVLCGLPFAQQVFSYLDPDCVWTPLACDGDQISKGSSVAKVQSSLSYLLQAERIALNFLQRLSGIASLTAQYVKQTQGSKTKILDTRKTLPLYRKLEKYAVRMGGGLNHRMGLFDQMMIKDNHVVGRSIEECVSIAKKAHPDVFLVVEIHQLDQIEPAIAAGADRLLLDNMDNPMIQRAQDLIASRVPIEVSGGVSLERIASLCELGVDMISVGALTHSARASDLSFSIRPI
ncbi:MAG: carboxylating nicotinate-nucleotide diphosphorylase [Bdellovibrionales bacterium]|nr:carboxylating nicotinate-nucleotide diphosphorylase [Bdellovibrionales bacterium]